MKIWIARTEAELPDIESQNYIERHPEAAYIYTKLFVYYDKPGWDHYSKMWIGRKMAEVPNYMFPEIKENEVIEFESKQQLKKL